MANKVKPKDSSEAAAILGLVYLDDEDFINAVHDPERHRSLPYTLADIQFQMDTLLEHMPPEQLFDVFARIMQREWMTILNHSILKAVEKKQLAAK